MHQAIAGGVKAPPMPTATRNRLLPRARSGTAIHRPIILFVHGSAGPSPTPIRNRTSQNATPTGTMPGGINSGAAAVNAVNSDHHRIAPVKTRRAPKRSPSHPPGAWNSAYPSAKALNSEPI